LLLKRICKNLVTNLIQNFESLLLTKFINVRVVDLRSEENLGGNHRVLFRQEELSTEEAAFVGGLPRASDLHKEVARVAFAGLSVDSDNYISQNMLLFNCLF